MKNLLVVLVLALAISACEKEAPNIIPDTTTISPSVVTLMDTLTGYSSEQRYYLTIKEFQEIDIIIRYIGGMTSSGYIEQIYISPDYRYDAQIAYNAKLDSGLNVNNSGDSTYVHFFFNTVLNLNLFDTINSELDFTSKEQYITGQMGNMQIDDMTVGFNNLVGLAPFYIAVRFSSYRTPMAYVWIKVEVLSPSKMVVHSYFTSTNCDELVISE